MTNAVNIAQLGTNNATFRNRIINGAMVIDQRYSGAATANTISNYTLDRWQVLQSTTGKLIVQQNAGAVTPPTGFTNYLGITSQSAYSVGASDYFLLTQYVEGYNMADLAWGTASASTVTVSFWVRSSLTGTFGGALINGAYTYTYPFTYTISSANTWEQKTVTITGPTAGAWLTTNGTGIQVRFTLGAGSTQLSSTINQWVSSGYQGPTGATSVVGTNGATFYITGVQLEAGSTASPFEYRSYGVELALCQRYAIELGKSSDNNQAIGMGYIYNTTQGTMTLMMPVPMRSVPSLTYVGTLTAANISINLTSLTVDTTYGNLVQLSPTLVSAGTAQSYLFVRYANQTTRQFLLSAEL